MGDPLWVGPMGSLGPSPYNRSMLFMQHANSHVTPGHHALSALDHEPWKHSHVSQPAPLQRNKSNREDSSVGKITIKHRPSKISPLKKSPAQVGQESFDVRSIITYIKDGKRSSNLYCFTIK